MFTIPVRVRGTDPKGHPFEAGGRTITLNRHGARIQVSSPLRPGQIVRVINQNNEHEADFRVVGPLSPPTERVGEWGLECIDERQNIWDIHFPPPAEGSDARALLECRKCHAVTLLPLSLVEVEVLETAGILTKHCEDCTTATPWGLLEKQFEMESAAFQAIFSSATERAALTADRRQSRRATIHVAARIRDYYGGSEVVQTENVSKEGLCFTTERKYNVGQALLVVCPYDPSGENLESRAHVVREQPLVGAYRMLYAVRYDRLAT